jgi:hypothetical protein
MGQLTCGGSLGAADCRRTLMDVLLTIRGLDDARKLRGFRRS